MAADRELHEAQRELRNSQRIGENTESRLLESNAVFMIINTVANKQNYPGLPNNTFL